MLTEDEARRLYREVLDKVSDSLARDIAVSVFSGALRGDIGSKTHDDTGLDEAQDLIPLSNSDALVVALRTLLSALDPIFQESEVKKILHPTENTGECTIVWDFDHAESTHVPELLEVPAQLVKVEPLPVFSTDDLSRMRQRVAKLADLLQEFESELEQKGGLANGHSD